MSTKDLIDETKKPEEMTQIKGQAKKSQECVICSKHFASSQYLKIHVQRVHEKMKPFQCKLCLKSFSQKNSSKLSHQNCP